MGCVSSRVDCVVVSPIGDEVPVNKVIGNHTEDASTNKTDPVQQTNGIDNKVFANGSVEDIHMQNTSKNKGVHNGIQDETKRNIKSLDGNYDLLSYESILSSLGKHDERKKKVCSSLSAFVDADKMALTAPASLKYSEDQLVAYLTEKFRHSDLLKLRVIWRWVTHNIVYDCESYFNPNSSDNGETENVLLSGKSVCSGYSNLFKTMGKLAGLQIECIPGWSKGYAFVTGSTFTGSKTNHLWNAVLLNESWWLFDCTWGAGYIDENKNFVQQYDEHFFMTDPNQFIYDHFPKDSNWQLLETAITMSEYENMALLTRHFFNAQMKPVTHKNLRIACSDGKVHLKFKISKSNPLTCVGSLINSEGIHASEQLIHIYTTEKVLHTHVLVPDIGDFTLELFAASAASALEDDPILPLICTYLINCTCKMDPIQTYPKQFKKWCHGFMLHSPMEGRLSIGATYTFKVSVTNVTQMAVCLGGGISTVTYMKNTSGKIWVVDVNILPGTERITVVAKFMNNMNPTFSSLLEYIVNTDTIKPFER